VPRHSVRTGETIMRNAIALSALLVAVACASGSQVSQKAANIPLPEITLISHTDLTNVPTIATAVPAHFEFRIVNDAEVPITLRSIDLVALGRPGIRVQSKHLPYTTVIQSHTVQSVDFLTTASIADPGGPTRMAPVQIRAVALFDSPQGSLEKVVVQQLRLDSGE
jgi:hypothetical protein